MILRSIVNAYDAPEVSRVQMFEEAIDAASQLLLSAGDTEGGVALVAALNALMGYDAP